MLLRLIFIFLLVPGTLAACSGESDARSEPNGQITRPGDVGLPLDNPEAVAAFDVADRFLLRWFFLQDIDRALEFVHADSRETWQPLLEETGIKRSCMLLQVEGSTPDAAGVVMARYAIGGCKVTTPDELAAEFIELTMTSGAEGPLVTQIEFLR